VKDTLVWIALLILLLLTWGVWKMDLGTLGTVLGLSIAVAKAALVMVFFMELDEATARTRLMIGGVGVWVFLLFGLTLADYFTRGPYL
jgi:cytochrome c oxidase subunit IV